MPTVETPFTVQWSPGSKTAEVQRDLPSFTRREQLDVAEQVHAITTEVISEFHREHHRAPIYDLTQILITFTTAETFATLVEEIP